MPASATLIYAHDPMCSWCWGFRPALAQLRSQLPEHVAFRALLGGLAADSDLPMPAPMQAQLQQTWQRIAKRIPGTRFNFDFWDACQPRRSTYPACRAVIAARLLEPRMEEAMVLAIQHAYYLEARNPSDSDTLIALAKELSLDPDAFQCLLRDQQVERILQQEIAQTQRLGLTSFPSLVLQTGPASFWPVAVDYNDPQAMLDCVLMLAAQ